MPARQVFLSIRRWSGSAISSPKEGFRLVSGFRRAHPEYRKPQYACCSPIDTPGQHFFFISKQPDAANESQSITRSLKTASCSPPLLALPLRVTCLEMLTVRVDDRDGLFPGRLSCNGELRI